MDVDEAWPRGRRRRDYHERKESSFRLTLDEALDALLEELSRAGAGNVTIYMNADLRAAHWLEPPDPSCVLVFQLAAKRYRMACDTWATVGGNLRAIGRTVEHVFTIERDGVAGASDVLTGFLEEDTRRVWWREVLDVPPEATWMEVKRVFRARAHRMHPDRPTGNAEAFRNLKRAFDAAREALESPN